MSTITATPFRLVLVLAALAGCVPTAFAADTTAATRIEARLLELGDEHATTATARLTAADLAVLGAHPRMLQRAGGTTDATADVAGKLVRAGDDDATAHVLARRLTPDDLTVLLAYPRMLQRAGSSARRTQSYIIGGLIIGGIVALAASSNGSATIMVHP